VELKKNNILFLLIGILILVLIVPISAVGNAGFEANGSPNSGSGYPDNWQNGGAVFNTGGTCSAPHGGTYFYRSYSSGGINQYLNPSGYSIIGIWATQYNFGTGSKIEISDINGTVIATTNVAWGIGDCVYRRYNVTIPEDHRFSEIKVTLWEYSATNFDDLELMNGGPWTSFNWSATPTTGTAPLTVNFAVQNSSPAYTYVFGDGGSDTPETSTIVSHVYSLPGLYSVTIQNASGLYGIYRFNHIIVTNSSIWTISATPSSINYGSTSSGLIYGGNISSISTIRWYVLYPGQALTDFYESNNHDTLNYAKVGSNWMGWDDNTGSFSNNKGTTFPNPVTLIPHYGGNLTVGCYIYLDDGSIQNPTTVLNVGQSQGLQNITFAAEDALTGSHVSPSTFNIHNLITNAWSNQSEIRPGQVDVQYPYGTNLFIEVIPPSASGYSTATDIYSVINAQGYTQLHVIPLWKNSSTNLSETTANLLVEKNSDFTPINGANIALSDGQSCTTGGNGACQFTLLNGTSYHAVVSATGYTSNTFYFIPTGASYSKAFMLVKIGETPTPIITVPTSITPSGTATPVIVPTGTGANAGNYTGFWGPIANGFKAAGAQPTEIGILLATLLIFAGFCVGGWSGRAYDPGAAFNGSGSLVGGIFGTVLSVAFGFIPLVWIIVLVALGFLAMILFR
jgi:hypothetical protein